MWDWIMKHRVAVITVCLISILLIYGYGCESRVTSIYNKDVKVTRGELQVELDDILAQVKLKVTDLNRQDAIKAVILQNAVLLIEGGPTNPVGILSAIAAIYGITQGANNVANGVRKMTSKRRDNNGRV